MTRVKIDALPCKSRLLVRDRAILNYRKVDVTGELNRPSYFITDLTKMVKSVIIYEKRLAGNLPAYGMRASARCLPHDEAPMTRKPTWVQSSLAPAATAGFEKDF